MGFLKLIFILLFLSSCAKNIDFQKNKANERQPIVLQAEDNEETGTKIFRMQGIVPLSDGEEIDLNELISKNTFLIFAEQFCDTCIHETEIFIDHLNNKTQAPDKINMITVLVGGIEIDAQDFKDFNEVPWDVGYDENSELYKQYCSKDTVPCLVIFNPEKGIVLSQHGALALEQILELTGSWE